MWVMMGGYSFLLIWLNLDLLFRKKEETGKELLNNVSSHILEPCKVRTGSGSSSYIIAEIIAAVKDGDLFEIVLPNPFKILWDLKDSHLICVLEAYWEMMKTKSGYDGQAS